MRYLQRLFQYGVIDQPVLTDKLLDNGFSPDDAPLIATMITRLSKIQRAAQIGTLEPKKIQALYQDGVFSRQEATTHLQDFDLTDHEIHHVLGTADLDVRATIVKAEIAAIRSCYLKGMITQDIALTDLAGQGIEKDRATRYIGLWAAERTCDAKLLSAKELVDECQRGILSISQLATRLVAQDYDLTAVAYYVAVAIADINKVLSSAATTRTKNVEALQKAVKAQLVSQLHFLRKASSHQCGEA